MPEVTEVTWGWPFSDSDCSPAYPLAPPTARSDHASRSRPLGHSL